MDKQIDAKNVQKSNRRGKRKGWQDSGRRDGYLNHQQTYWPTIQVIWKSTLALGDQNLVGKFTGQGFTFFFICDHIIFSISFSNKDQFYVACAFPAFYLHWHRTQVQKQTLGSDWGWVMAPIWTSTNGSTIAPGQTTNLWRSSLIWTVLTSDSQILMES